MSRQGPSTVAVALNRPFDGPLTYSVPPGLAEDLPVGALVEVPLARGVEIGCVIDHDSAPPSGVLKLRPVIRRVSRGFRLEQELIDLARWMSSYYLCGIGEALATVSMIGFSDLELKEHRVYRLAPDWSGCRMTARQRQAAEALAIQADEVHESLAEAARVAGASTAIIGKLLEAGVLLEERIGLPPPEPPPGGDVEPELLPEQVSAMAAVEELRRDRKFGVVLLHGVTGSGKTEVYLRLIRRVFDEGGSALCLVPEISLTPQTVGRFARRFREEIGVFHSQMTRREKRVLHEKIEQGRVRLVIGARSATFAPLPRLGLIVIDEEHEGSYKQGESPRYHARDVAIVRASRLGIPVLLGSATPSLESYENAQRGKYRLARLTARPAGLLMPEVRVVPMGRAAVENPDGVALISAELREAIADRLARGEQTLLFLNRRGFSNFLMCPSCKKVVRCEDDDIVLTIHRRGERGARAGEELELDLFPKPLAAADAFLKCHFCGRLYDYPAACPECGETSLLAVGSGTQRMEEALGRLHPGARILRLDQDAMTSRRVFLKAWQEMVDGEAQIILGTQMIAKGLHLERVTLVGVLLAEVGLFVPDFRAEERTFSLLMQVAGRAGRADAGQVIVQTYMPGHSSIQLAARHDYESFFEVEMQRRRKMRFPPVERLIALTLSDQDINRAIQQSRVLAGVTRRLAHRGGFDGVYTIGPQPAPIERLANRFRRRILLRCRNQLTAIALLVQALRDPEWHPPSSLQLTIDVDPMDLL